MKYNSIENTDLKCSVLGLGTWVFGGESWSGSKESDCLAAVQAALDQGINFIDTAPIYGNGKSETIVGQVLKGKREKVIVATKCGLIVENGRVKGDLSAQSIYKEVEESLKRLQTDYIDLYQCHWPDPKTPIAQTMEALNHLKSQHKIRYIGVSNFDLALIKEAKAYADIVTLQSQYSILERSLEKEIIPFCHANHMGFLAYGPLAGGILSGKYLNPPQFKGADARSFFYKYYQGQSFKKTQQIIKELAKIPRPLAHVAINWVKQNPAVTTVLVGCRNAAQVLQNVKAVEWDLTEEQIKEINHIKFK